MKTKTITSEHFAVYSVASDVESGVLIIEDRIQMFKTKQEAIDDILKRIALEIHLSLSDFVVVHHYNYKRTEEPKGFLIIEGI